MHFAQAAIEILEVAHAISHGERVKAVVGERKRHAIFLTQRDAVGKSGLFHLFAANGEHTLGEIGAGDVLWLQALHGKERKVARSGGKVEYLLRRIGLQAVDGGLSPRTVEAK